MTKKHWMICFLVGAQGLISLSGAVCPEWEKLLNSGNRIKNLIQEQKDSCHIFSLNDSIFIDSMRVLPDINSGKHIVISFDEYRPILINNVWQIEKRLKTLNSQNNSYNIPNGDTAIHCGIGDDGQLLFRNFSIEVCPTCTTTGTIVTTGDSLKSKIIFKYGYYNRFSGALLCSDYDTLTLRGIQNGSVSVKSIGRFITPGTISKTSALSPHALDLLGRKMDFQETDKHGMGIFLHRDKKELKVGVKKGN